MTPGMCLHPPPRDMIPGVTGNIVSQGIWHPRVKFPRDFGIPTGFWHPLDFTECGIPE